jgi:hypothetical protein
MAATGLAGTATITEVHATNTRVNDNPRCRLTLNVALPGRAVYQVTVTDVILLTDLPRCRPGSVFPVRVDADHLASVVLGGYCGHGP